MFYIRISFQWNARILYLSEHFRTYICTRNGENSYNIGHHADPRPLRVIIVPWLGPHDILLWHRQMEGRTDRHIHESDFQDVHNSGVHTVPVVVA